VTSHRSAKFLHSVRYVDVTDARGMRLASRMKEPCYDAYPRWSPDARQILFESNRSGDLDLRVIPAP
jgi:Tol biopolymer transport system component